MIKIYLAILTTGNIRFETARWLVNRIQEAKYDIQVQQFFSTPVQSNRNQVVKYFLETDCDYLAMLDSDIIPCKKWLDLIKSQREIISGLYFGWDKKYLCPFMFKFEKGGVYQDRGGKPFDIAKGRGIIKVDRTGAGALIIKREVLEKIKTPFEVRYDEDGIAPTGEDFCFFERAQKAGYKIFVDTDCICNHMKTVDLAEIYKYLQLFPQEQFDEVRKNLGRRTSHK